MKEYIGSQEHWEDSINADFDYKENMEREQRKEIEKQINEQSIKEPAPEMRQCTNNYTIMFSDKQKDKFKVPF